MIPYKTRLFVLFAVSAVTGCAMPRQGYIYSPVRSGRGTLSFPDVQANRGDVLASLASGERCHGRFSTVPGPEVTYDDEQVNVIQAEDTQNGMAVLECSNGHLLRCSFTRERAGAGMGTCRDNRGEQLTMYF